MQYMLLIHSDESVYPKMSEEEMNTLMAGYGKFTEELQSAGAMVVAHRLQPTHSATTVRIREGETMITDGPFAETKEQFGGYYIVEAGDLDEAMAWAAKIPTVKYGSVEVRPIWAMDD
ncbi:MAG: YciI family protein [Phycisphaerae bacterium]